MGGIVDLEMLLISEYAFAGKRAFIAGVADDNGYGWAIAKSLAAAGAEILVGTWVPVSELDRSMSHTNMEALNVKDLFGLCCFRMKIRLLYRR